MRTKADYIDNLQRIKEMFPSKELLTIGDVKRFTGIADNRTAKRRFPFRENAISVATLARCLSTLSEV